jgi:threonyl-tRNA synthetase
MLSTRPEKSVGTDAIWDDATNALIGALNKKGWTYNIDEGGGAFYGPKIDVKIRDAIGRLWQCSTIQCDFNLPERFELEYVSEENKRERPIMVHRAIFGSIERFFGILIENCAGEFPLWLAPTQLRLLPVTDTAQDYCNSIVKQGKKLGIRIEVDRGNERLAKQIRNAEQQRIPLIGVVGMKEVDNNTIAVRCRKLGGDIGSFAISDLLNEIQQCSIDATEMTKYGIIETKDNNDETKND